MPEESSSRFDSETYSKAKDSLKSTEAPSLEEKIKLAKEQEAATKKVADDVAHSRWFAIMWDKELYECRADATWNLLKWFEDFTQPVMVLPDTKPLTFNQNPSNREPRIPEKWAKPIVESRANTSTEVASNNSTELKTEKNDSAGTALTGSQEIKREAQVAQQSIESWNTSPDNMKKVMQSIENGYAMLPKGLQNFFKWIMNFIKWLSDNKDSNLALNNLLKNPNEKAILDKFAKTETGFDGKNGITFNEWAKITKSSKAKPQEWAPADTTESKSSKLDGNKIILEKDTKITSIKENIGTVTIIAQNKDGSTDTYIIADVKEQDKNTPPVTPSSTQVA